MRPNPLFQADSVTFTEEIRNGKLFFCAVLFPKNLLYLKRNLSTNFK